MPFPVSAYPKSIVVRDTVWHIRFVQIVEGDRNLDGFCAIDDQEIFISVWQSRDSMLETFLHEVIHAIEVEYDIDIPHKYVYVLGRALTLIFLGRSTMPDRRTRKTRSKAKPGTAKPGTRKLRSARRKASRSSDRR